MSRLDPLLMLAEIAQVRSARPELDPILVQALYRHLALTQDGQPTVEQATEYIDLLTSRLDDITLWQSLGLGAPLRRRPRTTLKPRRGRPSGSSQLTVAGTRAAYAALRSDQDRRPTQQQLASKLDVAVRTLQDFLQANDLTWPLES